MADDGNRQRKTDFKAAVEDANAMATVLAMEAESILGRRPAQVLGVVVLLAGVVGLLLALLNWYIDPGNAGERKDLILTSAQLLGGTALLSGLYFTWRTLQVSREGQITERFTRAIDQLGNDGREVRIGGIYALARIAEDSEVYYWPIIEILATYVRTRAPKPTTAASESGDNSEHEEDSEAGKERSHQHKQLDIQAILYILKDRKHHYDNGEDDFIRLTDTDLRNGDLRDVHFERARLRGANLQGARLNGARLCRARLRNVIFEKADLEKADLRGADLEEAILCKADLQGANLQEADLRKANLRDANLQGADLRKANLQDANLQDANLQDAKFRGALLQGALLQDAKLRGADLKGALLQGADLRGARELTQEQIEWTIGHNDTMLPEGLNHPQLWSKSIEGQAKIV